MAIHTIALVDDDNGLLEQLRALLENAGYIVRMLHGSDIAYAVLAAAAPSAIVIGLSSPDYQPAIDLATALMLDKRTRALPIILTSADTDYLSRYAASLRHRDIPTLRILPGPLDATSALQLLAQALGQPGQLVREAP